MPPRRNVQLINISCVVASVATTTPAFAFVPITSNQVLTLDRRSWANSHASPRLAALAANIGTVDGSSLAGLFSVGIEDERPSSEMANIDDATPADSTTESSLSSSLSSSNGRSNEMSSDGEVTEAQLLARTLETLDWPKILEALANEATTTLGRRLASQLELAPSLEAAQQQYAAVREAGTVLDALPPIRSAMDAEAELAMVSSGQVLDGAQMVHVSNLLSDLNALRSYLLTHPRAFTEDVDSKLASSEGASAATATATATSAAGNDASRFGIDRFGGDIPLLCGMVRGIILPDALVAALDSAFDEKQQLSEVRFPQLGALRRKAETLYASISSTVAGLMAGSLKDAVAEPRVMEVGGRFLLPIKPSYKNGVGIVHDLSRTGRTVYVEPAAVVEPTNELKAAQVALKVEEQRIYRELSQMIRKAMPEIKKSLEAAAEVDLVVARVKLGRRLGGQIPLVQGEGDIALTGFRHPVLVLRSASKSSSSKGGNSRSGAEGATGGNGIGGFTSNAAVRAANNAAAGVSFRGEKNVGASSDQLRPEMQVVGNDLSLNSSVPGLVLTGPNAGGKTIVLKSLGLAALLAKAGIPVPCAPGFTPRVDYFGSVLADIGDMQSVGGDLSTFSGHLLVCKAVLAQTDRAASNAAAAAASAAASNGGGKRGFSTGASSAGGAGSGASLVLMDEIGSGTDPAQGVALAQALLEAILATGAKTALTTHYLQLKDLAAADSRFEVAGMEFVDGKPTYRLKYGFVGESHALAVAERLQLPPPVISRARDLLDDGARRVSDLILKLEEETHAVEQERAALAAQQAEAATAAEKAKKVEEAAALRYADAWASAAADYAKRVKASEQRLEELVKELKGSVASAKNGKSLAEVAGNSLAEVRLVAKQAAQDADATPTLPVVPLTSADTLEDGEEVIINKKGIPWFGSPATVVKSSRNQVEVDVGGASVRLKKVDLARPADPSTAATTAAAATLAAVKESEDAVFQKQAEKLGITLEELFEKVDLNGDGRLSKEEVIEGHVLLGVSAEEAENMFDAFNSSQVSSDGSSPQGGESFLEAARRAQGAALLTSKAQAAKARKANHGGGVLGGASSARPKGLSKRTAAYSNAEATSPTAMNGNARNNKRGSNSNNGAGAGVAGGARPIPSGGKTSGNTVDLLGLTVDDATSIVERRMSNAQMSGMPTLYLLHGHGTGALKKGLRTWLRTSMGGRIRSWRPGNEADGGDAFTVVELK